MRTARLTQALCLGGSALFASEHAIASGPREPSPSQLQVIVPPDGSVIPLTTTVIVWVTGDDANREDFAVTLAWPSVTPRPIEIVNGECRAIDPCGLQLKLDDLPEDTDIELSILGPAQDEVIHYRTAGGYDVTAPSGAELRFEQRSVQGMRADAVGPLGLTRNVSFTPMQAVDDFGVAAYAFVRSVDDETPLILDPHHGADPPDRFGDAVPEEEAVGEACYALAHV